MLCAFVTHYQFDKVNFLMKTFTQSGSHYYSKSLLFMQYSNKKNMPVMYTIFRGFIFIIEFTQEKIEKESNTII